MALRQARLDWTLGQTPQPPPPFPSFEVGWGGAHSDGVYTPLVDGEGLGQGTRGWGLGLQGRAVWEGFSASATALALRDRGHTQGLLQRAAFAYQWDFGWRAALELAPLAWGSGLNGGDLLGDSARPFPRLSLATPAATTALGTWRLEAFTGRLEADPPVPDWMPQREARTQAKAAGLELRHPRLWGGLLRAGFGPLLEVSLGTATLEGGKDAGGRAAPSSVARTSSLLELRSRAPFLARLVEARGASLWLSRSAAPESRAWSLAGGRDLAGAQVLWADWDLALEYAAAASLDPTSFTQPTYLAGFTTRGDALGPAFGREVATRTVDLGLPLFLEGRGRLKVVRATGPADAWFLQAEAQWRTGTGRAGATTAFRRDEAAGAGARWGWALGLFQAFRMF